MHGNLLNKNKSKMFLTANSDLAARISILENNVYKITYYEIISGASGTLTVPTGATINSGEFSGANCVLSEIDGSNKPTFVTPLDGGGTPVTSTLNVGTGAWVKSGVTVSTNVALIYSIDITAALYQNLNNFYIIDNVLISSLSQVLTNSGTASTLSSELSRVISDETGSGSLVFGTSPTFTTDITTPLIIGGSAVGSNITYKSTSGTGTTTAAAHTFTGGTNGGTTIATLYNNGNFSIGNYASPNNLRLVTIGQDTAYMSLGSLVGTTANAALYMNQATPSATNYTLYSNGSGTVFNVPASTANLTFFNAGTTALMQFSPSPTQNSINFVTMSPVGNSTASTEFHTLRLIGNTRTWAAGTITIQRWNYLTANTAAFASASTITNSYGLYVEKAALGSNATITNNWSAGFDGAIRITGTSTANCAVVADNIYGYGALWTDGTQGLIARISNGDVVQIGDVNGKNKPIGFLTNASTRLTIGETGTSGAITQFSFIPASNTNQTASTEINGYLYNSYSRQWATGAITTQREIYYKTVTYTAVGASTITTAYGAYFEAPTASTNITITNNYAAGFEGNVLVKSVGSNKYYLAEDTLGKQVVMGADGSGGYVGTKTNHDFRFFVNFGTPTSLTIKGTTGYLDITDNIHFSFQTTNGTKFGTATTQKIGFWNKTPIVQPTTAYAAAAFTANAGTAVNDASTFDGYTIKQVVAALRGIGLLA